MILTDYHLHSDFSGDSQAPMEQMIERGLALGLKTMCFTEHMDYGVCTEGMNFAVDTDAYREGFLRLREKYRGQIELLFGIELGIEARHAEFLKSYARAYPFDFIIGSSHIVDGIDPYYREFYEGRTEEASYRRYFESILEGLEAFSDIDVYGHLDYIVRYGPNKNRYFSYEKYSDVIDPVLEALIGKGIGLEINSGGFSRGLGVTNPCPEIIRAYGRMGGEIVTVGSDAHDPARIADGFGRVREILLDAGFRYYTVFHGRRPEFVRL